MESTVSPKLIGKMIEYRLTNPNNATHIFEQILQTLGYQMSDERSKYVIIDGEKYGVCITSADKQYAMLRQFRDDYSGIITLWEKNCCIYAISDGFFNLRKNNKNRDYNQHSFYTMNAKYTFKQLEPNVRLMNEDAYKELYVQIAEKVSKDLILNSIRKMI